MTTLIHACVITKTLFSKKSDPARSVTITCSNKDNCDAFKKGQCVLINMGVHHCPYGKLKREIGYTQRAKNYYSWIKEKEDSFGGVKQLERAVDTILVVGDYVYLPYSFMNMNEGVAFLSKSHFMSSGSPFMLKSDFTLETILKIIKFKPQAMMGGEITDYQKVQVPKFLKHLSEKMPELYADVVKVAPEAAMTEKQKSNVGREAMLSTLKPNTGKFIDIHGSAWTWDGEYLTSTNSRASFMLISDFSELRLKAKEGVFVKVTSDEQVTAETIFKD